MRRYNIAFIVCVVLFFCSATSHAVEVTIDGFAITSSTLTVFDYFIDGQPPPCGPDGCASQPNFYGVNSTSPLVESGGLQLDSSDGILSANATGGARMFESFQVAGSESKLYNNNTGLGTSLFGSFTLPILSGPLNEGYGIRFIDAVPGGPGTNQEVLELNVQWWTGNATYDPGWYIRYLVQDFNSHTITTIDAHPVAIPTGRNEIYLTIHRDSGSAQFAAEYGYSVNGVTLDSPISLGSAQGFVYQPFVRGQVHAFETVVPEPGTLMLLGLGLAGLAALRRRKQ